MLLESTIVSLPLVFLIILFAAVVLKNNDVFILAFFSGLFLDFLTLGTIGLSGLYFITVVMLIFLYQKKFEIESLNFVTITALMGSLGYLILTHSVSIFSEVLFSTFLVFLAFIFYKKTNKVAPKYV
jgi:cell shape-determining protein MreD